MNLKHLKNIYNEIDAIVEGNPKLKQMIKDSCEAQKEEITPLGNNIEDHLTEQMADEDNERRRDEKEDKEFKWEKI